MGICAKFMGAFCLNFYDPILSLHLESNLGMRESKAFLGFSLISLTYSIGSILFAKWSENSNKQVIIFLSFLFFAVSIYMSGGVSWLAGGSTSILVFSMCGLGGVGFFQAGTLVPVIPEVMEAVQAELNDANPAISPKYSQLSPSLRRQHTIDELLA